MKYTRAKVIHSKRSMTSTKFYHGCWHYCQETDIPHTVLEAMKVKPNEPVVIAGWAYRVIV